MIQIPDNPTGFKIGTAAKMAGISPNTIRTWMRRDYFKPSMETESGERILSSSDIQRLIQLKSLIELGDSIGRIAKLDDEALGARLDELRSASDTGFSNEIPSLANLRAAFVSSPGSNRLSSCAHFFWNNKTYESAAALNVSISDKPDYAIVLFDFQNKIPTEKDDILEFASRNPRIPAVVVFDFMPSAALQELSKARVHLLRWPVNSIMMERYLYGLLPLVGKGPTDLVDVDDVPAREFTERQLAHLADSQPHLECECPRHVSALVASLGAFEDYSQTCSVRNPADAAMHEYLKKETAKARHIMERALLRICREDGIAIPAP